MFDRVAHPSWIARAPVTRAVPTAVAVVRFMPTCLAMLMLRRDICCWLLRRHPRAAEKLNGKKHVVVEMHRCGYLIVMIDGELVSWNKCMKGRERPRDGPR